MSISGIRIDFVLGVVALVAVFIVPIVRLRRKAWSYRLLAGLSLVCLAWPVAALVIPGWPSGPSVFLPALVGLGLLAVSDALERGS